VEISTLVSLWLAGTYIMLNRAIQYRECSAIMLPTPTAIVKKIPGYSSPGINVVEAKKRRIGSFSLTRI
jgi:hypothetical protein